MSALLECIAIRRLFSKSTSGANIFEKDIRYTKAYAIVLHQYLTYNNFCFRLFIGYNINSIY